jgi:hypothetical protein
VTFWLLAAVVAAVTAVAVAVVLERIYRQLALTSQQVL